MRKFKKFDFKFFTCFTVLIVHELEGGNAGMTSNHETVIVILIFLAVETSLTICEKY